MVGIMESLEPETIALIVVAVARGIVIATDTQGAWWYKLIELLALEIGKSKQKENEWT